MRPRILFILLSLTLSVACRKKSEPAPPIDTNAPLLINRLVYRFENSGGTYERKYQFEYDASNQIIEIKDSSDNDGVRRYTFEYESNGDLRNLRYFENGRFLDYYEAPSTLSFEDGTLQMTTVSSTDTAVLRYIFQDSTLLEQQFETNAPVRTRVVYNYNSSQNLVEKGYYFGDNYSIGFRCTGWDDKPNFIRQIPPFSIVFADPLSSLGCGKNNITRIEQGGEVIEYEYTYNQDEFPLTIRDKSEDFVKYEITYVSQD